jgi:hypothetical protein
MGKRQGAAHARYQGAETSRVGNAPLDQHIDTLFEYTYYLINPKWHAACRRQ